ncbi:MAG: peptide chain release factor N(5)-glutamine methyltransferase [Gemmatimonadota bacterium]
MKTGTRTPSWRSSISRPGTARHWTVLTLLRTTTRFLEERGASEPRLSAEHLLGHVLGMGRLQLYLDFDRPLEPDELDAYRRLVKRRLTGEPVAYIVGRVGFRDLELDVDRRVLVPRPETELLVGHVLEWARAEAARGARPGAGWRMVDVGTGSGAIACALAVELEGVERVLGIDANPAAVALARSNARRAGAEQTLWLAADLFEALRPGTEVDAIVANPPYLADGERDSLAPEVARWEPPDALFAGPTGEEAIRRLVEAAPGRLRPAGLLAFEVGLGQAERARSLVQAVPGLRYVSTYRDHAGIERGILAVRER